jgi:DNA-binding PadR family transcriptional regulator
MYLDFAESFHEMLDDGLIVHVGENSDGDKIFSVTDKGTIVASELKSDILPSILDQSLACALRYLDFKRRNVTIKCTTEKQTDGRCLLRCAFIEKEVVLFSAELLVDSVNRAERMKENFRDKPEAVYRGFNALLAGNVNFLFD